MHQLQYVQVLCCRDIISHPGGNMPATAMFGSSSIPIGYARDNTTLLCLLLCLVLCPTRPPDLVPVA